MDEINYNLIFNGRIAFDSEIDEVKRNLCSLLKTDPAKVESMFDGRTIVLKKNISRADAERYKVIFDRTGAISIFEPVSNGESPSTVQPQPPVIEKQVSCPTCGMRQKEIPVCAACGFLIEKPANNALDKSSVREGKESIICPKCNTPQEKSPTCMRCGVIFEKIAAHSERQPPDQQPSDPQPPEKQQIKETVPVGNQVLHMEKTVLPGTRAYFVTLSVILVVGCCSLVYSSVKLVKTITLLNTAQTATGTVIGFSSSHSTGGRGSSSPTRAPEVDFRAPDGRLIRFVSGFSCSYVPLDIGDQVSVCYEPANPYHAEINAFIPLWGASLFTFLFGIALIWSGWRMIGIQQKAKSLNFAQYAKGKGLTSDLIFCPKCGIQQPPTAVCRFCQADIAALQNSVNRWQNILLAASGKGTVAGMSPKEIKIKYAVQFLVFLLVVSSFGWQVKAMLSISSHPQRSIPVYWRDSTNKVAILLPADWKNQSTRDLTDYPMLQNQRNDRYFLILSPQTGEKIYLAYGSPGLTMDHFRSAGWEGIVAEIGSTNKVKFADVAQFNALTVYRIGYELPDGYREDAYIEGEKELVEVCFVMPNGADVAERATRVRNMLTSNLTGI